MPERRFAAVLLLALLGARTGLAAESPTLRLGVPVDCDMARDCFVQNYVDHDPGPAAKDQTCGPLTYDGHDGIDIRVAGRPEMEAGVPVVAAAAGTVVARRDGLPDISFRDRPEEAIRGREAGNGVRLDHGDGWQTQYSHLRRGSVAVEPGEAVAAGRRLGLIGLSGKTEFPHLHFTVRHRGAVLDPFTGTEPGSGCGAPGEGLWTPAAAEALAYRAGGLLLAGFADGAPALPALLDGPGRAREPDATSPALVFWSVAWGLRAGDRETIILRGPDGKVVAESESRLPGDKAQWLRYAGRKAPAGGWPAGTYRGTYRVERDAPGGATTVVAVERALMLR